MSGARRSFAGVDCAVAQAIEQMGDPWILLILRCQFQGIKRFDDFQGHLQISSSVLTDRLGRLVKAGLLHKEQDKQDKRGTVYLLTEKGLDFYPVMIALHQWSERWEAREGGPRLELLDKVKGEAVREVRVLSQDYKELGARDVVAQIGDQGGDMMQDIQDRLKKRRGDTA
ncbi:helix-turn-helix domain-containing protein [Pseudovibrio sp. Tun.PSC04-5.I4]|uniref:winged helix-turn-helix transcriptional regulator n=1 Tax=Pseudovibrio sp. Tun.PSC04-5.I4 TaxID=1798213 RepID=UPI00088F783D|nr:helix-turn-helix domain-containing protein [Pseudovibrio sp. Tun.PSC04-5.I4]SDR38292.1 DNA-binding transcriptional regulator, HxlR family [Pseudovibrio sp. Tun.PSC04-5.I4]